jgi:hypothetical protein
MKLSLITAFALVSLSITVPVYSQDDTPEPAPRNADGRILLDAQAGEANGLWVTNYGTGLPSFIVEEIPFRTWTKGLFDQRQTHDLEPHARCKASGAIRQFLTPYGVEILELEDIQQLYIFDIGGPHSYRPVYMDGRSHPSDLMPSNYGHSIGWWEGDTLVIDSVGYNEDFWFERMGIPHTKDVHIVEYLTRTDKQNMKYRFELNDPTAYTGPVIGQLSLGWREGEELFEYMCQQSNYAEDLMLNDEFTAIGKTSLIVP